MTNKSDSKNISAGADDAMCGLTPCDRWAFRLLCAAVFCVAFSLPAGRTMAALSLVVLTVDCIRNRRRPVFSVTAWCWVAFLAVAVFASAQGVNPARSFNKIHKLFWFAVLPVASTLIAGRPERIGILLRSFVMGCGVLALQVVVWRPFAAWLAVREAVAGGEEGDYLWAITDLGSMTDGQMLMIGITAVVGLIVSDRILKSRTGRLRVADLFLAALLVLALVVNLKRGSWICTFAVMGIFIAAQMRLRHLLVMAVVAVGLLMLPPVWSRFSDLRQEFDSSRGGRIVMWTKIAPAIIREHRFGIGYRALTFDMMKEVADEQGVFVEAKRDHLHCNPVQVLVSLGWAGLAVYLVWMIAGFASGLRMVRRFPAGSAQRVEALSLVLMLLGLIINGLIEYNLGDAELVIPYAVVLGMMWNGGTKCAD